MTMRVEEIAIHCSIFVATTIIGLLLYQVLKYLNSKPLGLQIVLDDLTKDAMVILGLTMTYTWITWIKLTQQYDYHLAKIIIDIGVAFAMPTSRLCIHPCHHHHRQSNGNHPVNSQIPVQVDIAC